MDRGAGLDARLVYAAAAGIGTWCWRDFDPVRGALAASGVTIVLTAVADQFEEDVYASKSGPILCVAVGSGSAAIAASVTQTPGVTGDIDWSRVIVDAASLRAKRGIADRPKPGRSRQTRLEDPRFHRPERAPARTGGLGGEPPRLPGDRSTDVSVGVLAWRQQSTRPFRCTTAMPPAPRVRRLSCLPQDHSGSSEGPGATNGPSVHIDSPSVQAASQPRKLATSSAEPHVAAWLGVERNAPNPIR
jgi:hypothetical protein